VEKKRNEFRIPCCGSERMKWTAEKLAMLDTFSDAEVAAKLGLSIIAVKARRKRIVKT